MRNRKIEAVQFRNQDARLGAKRGRNVPDAIVVVGIALMKDVEELTSGKVNALALAVVRHVIDHGRGRVTAHNLARIRIQNHELSRNARPQKQAMAVLIEGNGRWILSRLGNGPRRLQLSAGPVINFNSILSADIDEHAWP